MRKWIFALGALLIFVGCLPLVDPDVVIEETPTGPLAKIKGDLTGVESYTTFVLEDDTIIRENRVTDTLTNEACRMLSSGDMDKVEVLGINVKNWDGAAGTEGWCYYDFQFDGGAYDTCGWVRWKYTYVSPEWAVWDSLKEFHMMSLLTSSPLLGDETYCDQDTTIVLVGGQQLVITWTFTWQVGS